MFKTAPLSRHRILAIPSEGKKKKNVCPQGPFCDKSAFLSAPDHPGAIRRLGLPRSVLIVLVTEKAWYFGYKLREMRFRIFVFSARSQGEKKGESYLLFLQILVSARPRVTSLVKGHTKEKR